MVEVLAKRQDGREVKSAFDFGDSLQVMIDKFGEEAVFSAALGAIKVALQGYLRSLLDQGKTQEEIDAAVGSWKPGQRKQGKSPQEKLRAQLDAMSPEDRAAILKEYKAAKAA